jgi:hypothetical protein
VSLEALKIGVILFRRRAIMRNAQQFEIPCDDWILPSGNADRRQAKIGEFEHEFQLAATLR